MNNFGGYEEPTSRAFWGSEDPEEDSTPGPTFTLEWLTDFPSSIKTLALVTGNIVTGIIERCINRNVDRICTINSTAEFNVAALYKLSNDVYVFTFASTIDITSAGKLVDTGALDKGVQNYLFKFQIIRSDSLEMACGQIKMHSVGKISEVISKSEKIVVFTDQPISRLTGTERDNVNGPTLWRSLTTKKGRDDRLQTVPLLKHPNFIVGIAAGVIGYAEMMDLPATLYILYVADDAYEAETIEPIVKLFTEVTKSPLPKIDSTLKTFNSNKLKLYI